jgi:DNA ligase-1
VRLFAETISIIDSTTKTSVKEQALTRYFQKAPKQDQLWAIAFFTHRRPKRPVTTTLLRQWASEIAQIPLWLFEESYHVVGDLAETISLLVPHDAASDQDDLTPWVERIICLRGKPEDEQRIEIERCWRELDSFSCFLFNKILTGGFRIGVSQKILTKALAKALDTDSSLLAHRLMGNWDPQTVDYDELLINDSGDADLSRPYPFYLAYAVDDVEELGNCTDWYAERKWDGIRGQLIKREDEFFVWTRGEELVTDRYPEFQSLSDELPSVVLDGEILGFKDGLPLDFHQLQKRIGRKRVGKKLLNDVPVVFVAYDLLEADGKDLRNLPLSERRKRLEQVIGSCKTDVVQLSELVDFDTWNDLKMERERSRELHCEGLMIKRKDSVYEVGRKRGSWWKWKVDPLTIDAVLTYAQRGHGRRANLYTDYTFALWNDGELITIAKAYSGLTDSELKQIDRFVKQNSLEKFGPVRRVKPELVFELAFEGVAKSTRHKSGVAVRFPRILRMRTSPLKKPTSWRI